MKFSEFFKLGKEQAELDFVDVDPQRDTGLYVDPYALEVKEDQWSRECGDHIRSFFTEVLGALRKGDNARAQHLMSHLREPRDTYLGVSMGRPRGRGVGDFQSDQMLDALRDSVAFKTGLLEDLAEAELFIRGIGRDKIPDLTTNIIRGPLIEYTQKQCELHGVQLRYAVPSGPVWNPVKAEWEQRYTGLPFVERKKVLLVPKYSVRWRLSLESREFYEHHVINFLQAEYENVAASLARVLSDGRPRVYKKDVKEKHPLIKDELARFAQEHPEVLQQYKALKTAQGPLGNEDIDEGFDEAVFAGVLQERLKGIREGNDAASEYHAFIMGVLTFLFYPDLIRPMKEREIHEGRKRIDILFTNAAQSVFFHQMLAGASTRSQFVPVECKNYSQDVGNPEFDQLAQRFGHQRGFFGILMCRSLLNRDIAIKRCRDTANDGRGFVIVLVDDDVQHMLGLIASRRRNEISAFLGRCFAEITL